MTPYELLKKLYPINRSITGKGVEMTLRIIQETLNGLQILKIPSGTQCFDWVVPDEWNVQTAFLENDRGERVLDFQKITFTWSDIRFRSTPHSLSKSSKSTSILWKKCPTRSPT